MAFCMSSAGLLAVAAAILLFLSLVGSTNGFEHATSVLQWQHRRTTAVRRPLRSLSMASEREYERESDQRMNVKEDPISLSRRSATVRAVALLAATAAAPSVASAKTPNGLILTTAPTSGLRWADAKVGSGEALAVGSTCSIDFSMASTAGRFPSIYSTKNGDAPYRWTLGDGSTIKGIELAILGCEEEGIPAMKPGGIRRVIVPNSLGFNALIQQNKNASPASNNKRCLAGNEGSIGPIPPKDAPDGAYQRWYQFYCNPRIPYQPDLVLDIKLYGKRT